MSELHIPPEVADAMRALRPELRKKLSLRDIDDMTRPFRKRIAELEATLAAAKLQGCREGRAFAQRECADQLRAALAAARLQGWRDGVADAGAAVESMAARARRAGNQGKARAWDAAEGAIRALPEPDSEEPTP